MNAVWSAQQQQWLKALGHTLYVQGAALIERVEEAAPRHDPAPAANAAPARRRSEPAEAVPQPARVVEPPARRGASRLPDKLHFALIRASGCNPGDPESARAIALWPPSSELRGNPAAKRALWPRLRALRRQPTP